ncbi:hypothetical protein TRFO_36841 [Tritrichomonas foetus]|uniref:Uncharacterized protein n=1 Tax=Tritrichomonas foetus TaxID=1144522 RepID=A0A1J4JCS6_9EUKA|nr:hypothetical protein TRFO_36841 [Tritrichomonas foetus]|eukprot:OHS97010.1 hypothetical protein TRFO_36841 [Tritrichomonas foetus]
MENEINKLQEEIDDLPSKREEIGEKQEEGEKVLNKIQIYQNILNNLNDINEKFSRQAKEFVKAADNNSENLNHQQRMQIELLKRQLKRADDIREEFDLMPNDENSLADEVSTSENKSEEKQSETKSEKKEKSLAEKTKAAIQTLQMNIQNTIPIIQNLDKNLEAPIPDQDTVTESEFCTSRMTSEAFKSPDYSTINNNTICQCPIDLTAIDNSSDGAAMTVLEPDFDPEEKRDEVEKIINEEFPYLKKYPEIDPKDVKIKKHRDPKPVNKRKNEIEFEEVLDENGNISFERKPIEYEKSEQQKEDGTVQKIKVPKEYERFQVEEEDGSKKKVRRPKLFEYAEDHSEGGTPILVKRKVNFEYKEVEDENGNKKRIRTQIPKEIYQEVEGEDGKKKLEKLEVPYKDIDYTCEDGTIKKIKKEDIPIEFEYAEIEGDDDDTLLIVKMPKKYNYVETELEDGAKAIIKKEAERDDDFEYQEIIDENGNKEIIKKPINFEIVDYTSDEGTVRKIRRPIKEIEYDYSEVEDEEGNKKILKKPKNFEYFQQDSQKIKREVPKDEEFEYDEVEDEDGNKKIVRRPKFTLQDVESENGTVHKVRKYAQPPEEFEYDEVLDEDGNKIVQKVPKVYETKEVEDEDGHKRIVRYLKPHDIEFEYDEIEDDEGNKKLEKREIKFEEVLLESEGGTKHKVRRPVPDPEYEFIQVEKPNGDKNIVKVPKRFQRKIEEGEDGTKRIIRRELPHEEEFEYEEVEDENNENKIIKKPKQFEEIQLESEGGSIIKVRREVPKEKEFEYSASEDENGDPIIVKREKQFEVVDQESENGTIRKVRRQVPKEEQLEFIKNDEGEVVQQLKVFEYIELESENGTKHKVRKEVLPPLSYRYKEQDDGTTVIIGKPKIAKKFTDDEGRDVKFFVSESDGYEYDEVEQEDGTFKIMKKKPEFITEKGEDENGNIIEYKKIVRNSDTEYEYDEIENDECVPVVQKHKKLPKFVEVKDSEGNQKLIRKTLPKYADQNYETLKLQDDDGNFLNINRLVKEDDPFKQMLSEIEGKGLAVSQSDEDASESSSVFMHSESEDETIQKTINTIKTRKADEEGTDSDELTDSPIEENQFDINLIKELEKEVEIPPPLNTPPLSQSPAISSEDEEQPFGATASSEEEAEFGEDVIEAFDLKVREIAESSSETEPEEEPIPLQDAADKLLTESQELDETEFHRNKVGSALSNQSDASLQPTNILEHQDLLQETDILTDANRLHSSRLNPSSIQSDVSFQGKNDAENELGIQDATTEGILGSSAYQQNQLISSMENQTSASYAGQTKEEQESSILGTTDTFLDSSNNFNMLDKSMSSKTVTSFASGDNALENQMSIQSQTEGFLGSSSKGDRLNKEMSSNDDSSYAQENTLENQADLQSQTERLLGSSDAKGEKLDQDMSSHPDSIYDRKVTAQDETNLQESEGFLGSNDSKDIRLYKSESEKSISSYIAPTNTLQNENNILGSSDEPLLGSDSVQNKLKESGSAKSVDSFAKVDYKFKSSISTQTSVSTLSRNSLSIVTEAEARSNKIQSSAQTTSSFVYGSKNKDINMTIEVEQTYSETNSTTSLYIDAQQIESLTDQSEVYQGFTDNQNGDGETTYEAVDPSILGQFSSSARIDSEAESLNISSHIHSEVNFDHSANVTMEDTLSDVELVFAETQTDESFVQQPLVSEVSFEVDLLHAVIIPDIQGESSEFDPLRESEATDLLDTDEIDEIGECDEVTETVPMETQTNDSIYQHQIVVSKTLEFDGQPEYSESFNESESVPEADFYTETSTVGAQTAQSFIARQKRLGVAIIPPAKEIEVSFSHEQVESKDMLSTMTDLTTTLDQIDQSLDLIAKELGSDAELHDFGTQTDLGAIEYILAADWEEESEAELDLETGSHHSTSSLCPVLSLGQFIDNRYNEEEEERLENNLLKEEVNKVQFEKWCFEEEEEIIERALILEELGKVEDINEVEAEEARKLRMNEEEEQIEKNLVNEEDSKLDSVALVDELDRLNKCEEEEENIESRLIDEEANMINTIEEDKYQSVLNNEENKIIGIQEEEEESLEDKLFNEEQNKSDALRQLAQEEEEEQLENDLSKIEEAKLQSEENVENELENARERECVFLENDKEDELHKLAEEEEEEVIEAYLIEEERMKFDDRNEYNIIEEENKQDELDDLLNKEEEIKLDSLARVNESELEYSCIESEVNKLISEERVDDSEQEIRSRLYEDDKLDDERRYKFEEEEELIENKLIEEERFKLEDFVEEEEEVVEKPVTEEKDEEPIVEEPVVEDKVESKQIEETYEEEEVVEYSETVTVVQVGSMSSSGSSMGEAGPPKLWNFMSEYSNLFVDALMNAIGKPIKKEMTTQTNTKLVHQKVIKKSFRTTTRKRINEDNDNNDEDFNEEEEIPQIDTLPPISVDVIDKLTDDKKENKDNTNDEENIEEEIAEQLRNEEEEKLSETEIGLKEETQDKESDNEIQENLKEDDLTKLKDQEEEELSRSIKEEAESEMAKDEDENKLEEDLKGKKLDEDEETKDNLSEESQEDFDEFAKREEEIADEEIKTHEEDINEDIKETKRECEEKLKDIEEKQVSQDIETEKIRNEEEIKGKETQVQEFEEKEEKMFGAKSKKHRELPDFEYDELSDDDGSRIIKKNLVPYEEIIKDGKTEKQRVPYETEYEYIEDPINKSIVTQREVLFEFADVESVGGTVRNVRRPKDEIEFEWDVIEEQPDTIEKVLKVFNKTWEDSENGTAKRRIRHDVTHPDEEFEYEEIEDEHGNKKIVKTLKKFEFADVESEGGSLYNARRRVQEFEYDEVDDEDGNKKIIKQPIIYDWAEIESENGTKRKVKRNITKFAADDEEKKDEKESFEYDEIEDEEGNKKYVRRQPQYEFVEIESEGGTIRKVKRQAEDTNDFDYELEDDENGEKKVSKKPKQFEFKEIESEGGTVRKVRKQVPCDDDFEYDEVDNKEEGGKKVIKREKLYEYDDIESEGGSIHRVRREVHPSDDFEYEEVDDEEQRSKRSQHGEDETCDQGSIKFREEDEPCKELQEISVIKKLKPFDWRDDVEEDGHTRHVRFETVHEPVYTYQEVEDEDGNKKLEKVEIPFETIEALCDDGKTRTIRKRIPQEGDFEEVIITDENGNQHVVKRPIKYEYETRVDENGNIITVRKRAQQDDENSDELVEVIDENGERHLVRKDSIKDLNKDGNKRNKRRVRKLVKRLVKRGDGSSITDSTIKFNDQASQITTTPVTNHKHHRGNKLNRSQSFSYFDVESPIKTIQPQGSSLSLNMNTLQKSMRKHHHHHGETGDRPSDGTISIGGHHRHHAVDSKEGGASDYSFYSYDEGDLEFDEDGEFRSRTNNRSFARKIWNNAFQRKIDRAQLEVSISDAQYELAVARANTKDIADQIELTEFEIRQRQPNLEFMRAMVSNFSPMPVMDRQAGAQTTLTAAELRMMDIRVKDCLETNEAKEIQKENAETLQNYLDNLRRKRKQCVDKYSNIDEEIKELEEQIQLFKPDGEDDALPPETRHRIKLERKLEQQQQRNEQISKKLKTDATQVRKLKGRLEDMKNIHDMLKKKLAEERRNERPDVTQMVRRLNILKRNERGVREKAKLAQMEEENADNQLEALENFTSTDNVERIKQNMSQMNTKIAALKEQFGIRKRSAVRKRKFGLTNKNNMEDLEMRRRDINQQLSLLARKEDDLRENIERVSKAMATKRLRVPQASSM